MNTYVKTLSGNDLAMLTELFRYKDVEQMMAENKKHIECGAMDIFALFYDAKLIGELRVKYYCQDHRFAQKGRRAYLYAFRIHKNYQGRGFGKYLLKHVLNELQLGGYSEFTIGVEDDNPKAQYIYKKYGFTTVIARIRESYQRDSYEYNLLLRTGVSV